MGPTSSLGDAGDLGRTDVEVSSQSRVAFTHGRSGSDVHNLFLSELGPMTLLSPIGSVPKNHVVHVVGVVAQQQMSRIATLRSVTVMPDQSVVGEFSDENFMSYSMGIPGEIAAPDYPVATFGARSRPQPAGISGGFAWQPVLEGLDECESAGRTKAQGLVGPNISGGAPSFVVPSTPPSGVMFAPTVGDQADHAISLSEVKL